MGMCTAYNTKYHAVWKRSNIHFDFMCMTFVYANRPFLGRAAFIHISLGAHCKYTLFPIHFWLYTLHTYIAQTLRGVRFKSFCIDFGSKFQVEHCFSYPSISQVLLLVQDFGYPENSGPLFLSSPQRQQEWGKKKGASPRLKLCTIILLEHSPSSQNERWQR